MSQIMSLIERYIAAYNDMDIPKMLACFADDCVFENVSNANGVIRLNGIEALGAQAKAAQSYFSQRCQNIINYVENTNKVAIEVTYEASVAVDLPNGIKAGDKLALRGCSFFTISDGKITRLTDFS